MKAFLLISVFAVSFMFAGSLFAQSISPQIVSPYVKETEKMYIFSEIGILKYERLNDSSEERLKINIKTVEYYKQDGSQDLVGSSTDHHMGDATSQTTVEIYESNLRNKSVGSIEKLIELSGKKIVLIVNAFFDEKGENEPLIIKKMIIYPAPEFADQWRSLNKE